MKLINTFFCDDVRFEVNNKLSLIGLYDDKMVYPAHVKFPIQTRITILLKFKLEKDDPAPRHFEFKYFMNEKEIMKADGDMQQNITNDNIQLAINAEGLVLDAGELGYSITVFDAKKNKLISKKDSHALKVMAT